MNKTQEIEMKEWVEEKLYFLTIKQWEVLCTCIRENENVLPDNYCMHILSFRDHVYCM